MLPGILLSLKMGKARNIDGDDDLDRSRMQLFSIDGSLDANSAFSVESSR